MHHRHVKRAELRLREVVKHFSVEVKPRKYGKGATEVNIRKIFQDCAAFIVSSIVRILIDWSSCHRLSY